MINLNKLNNQQLEDRIYFIQREMQYDHGYMRASTVNKKMDEILKIRRILKEREQLMMTKKEAITCDYCEGEGRYSLESGYQREENKIECHVCLGSGEISNNETI